MNTNTSNAFSQQIDQLITALSKAQAAIKGADEDCSNPFFKSRYADLTAVWQACKQPLADNGLAVIQTTEIVDGRVCLVTTLAHSSGQWMRGYLPLMYSKETPQDMGSAMTYARRYALASIVGVCPKGDDDDAETAMKPHRDENAPKLENNQSKLMSPKQVKFIEDLIGGDIEYRTSILSQFGKVNDFSKLPATYCDNIISIIKLRNQQKQQRAAV